MCVYRSQVDTIDWCTERLDQCCGRLDAARLAILTGRPSADAPLRRCAFVAFMSAREASMATQARAAHQKTLAAVKWAGSFWP